MQNRIIVPVDFSDNAWNAIIYASKLYVNEYCTFFLLHSIKVKALLISNLSNKFLNTIRNKALKELSDFKQKIECVNTNSNHRFKIIISDENLKEALEINIIRNNIQLIIMGTKGASKAKKLFFRSNTVNVITKVKLCPILVIPSMFEFSVPKKVAFSTDFNHFFQKNKLAPLKELIDLYNSEVSIVHLTNEKKLNEFQAYNSNVLENNLIDYRYHYYWVSNYVKKVEDINSFIKNQKINILVMVNYKNSFIEKITKEPIVKTIGYQPIIPFLVIPD